MRRVRATRSRSARVPDRSTIDGFEFFGGSRAIEFATGAIDDVRILNNRVYGFTNRGLFLNDNGINITIDQNDIDNRVDRGTRSFDKNTFDSTGRRW